MLLLRGFRACSLGFLAVLACAFTVATSILAPSALAQVTTSAIHGTVTDASGAVVPNAKVTALNTATGIAVNTTTDRSGYYTFTALQPGGPYTVTVEAPGFNTFQASGITLSVNANWDADAKMLTPN